MGMFDDLECTMRMPDGHRGPHYQTKDLDCTLNYYRIDGGSLLLVHLGSGTTKDMNYHGKLNFYDLTRDHWWHEYEASFNNGSLESIKVIAVRPPPTPDAPW